ncbi:nickel transporter permease NikB [Agrobacterium sp. DSM 25558]|nr:nickel transporter permease NikB [Agrobacterium sp. DSM 25558]
MAGRWRSSGVVRIPGARPGGLRQQWRPIDRVLHAVSLVGASTPNFFFAAPLVIVFSVMLGWVPTFGTSGFTSWLLPWVTIGLFRGCMLKACRVYHFSNVDRNEPSKIWILVCKRRCAPVRLHCICCFLADRLLMPALQEPLLVSRPRRVESLINRAIRFKKTHTIELIYLLYIFCRLILDNGPGAGDSHSPGSGTPSF